MPRNVEIKARAADLDAVDRRAAARADHGPETLVQEDVFFQVPRGRLKLRSFPDGRGELIHYERPDATEPTECRYRVVPVQDTAGLRELLSQALGVRGIVRKQRRLYLRGQTRIHLDRVEGLGAFVELEVVLRDEQSPQEGAGIAERIMQELGIPRDGLVDVAYVDLLE